MAIEIYNPDNEDVLTVEKNGEIFWYYGAEARRIKSERTLTSNVLDIVAKPDHKESNKKG